MGIFCKFVGMLCIFHCPFRMPVATRVVTLLIVFRSGTVGACRHFMPLRGLPMCFLHGSSSQTFVQPMW